MPHLPSYFEPKSAEPKSRADKAQGSPPEHIERLDRNYVETAVKEPQPSRWKRVKRHYAKWWWVHLIVAIVLLAILLPIT